MYLAELKVEGFRKIKATKFAFTKGLNVILGENNAGKTAVIDGLRALLATTAEGTLRLDDADLHVGADSEQASEISFSYVFDDLSDEEEANFFSALKPSSVKGKFRAHFHIKYSISSSGRLRPTRWCGDHEENSITADMLEDLRATYLPALRDPSSGLRPSRSSQIARLLVRQATTGQKDEIVKEVRAFEETLEQKDPVASTQTAIDTQYETMLGEELKQVLKLGLTAPDFNRIASRLQVAVDTFDVEQNGLGYNNLIYMAVVLTELETNPDSAYRALIIEEPEAHLHPQLQAVLLQFLQGKEPNDDEDGNTAVALVADQVVSAAPVQIFVTSHSPNFASIANIDSLCCVHKSTSGVKAFSPREVVFKPKHKKDKLQRYLDVTRAELFFARRVILVEGTAELFLVNALAKKAGYDLRKKSVTLMSTEGLNFDCFLPLFGENALNVRVALLTDADPPADEYPAATDTLKLSDTARTLDASKTDWVRPFFAHKTLEYDLALHEQNHSTMLQALQEMHPEIGAELEEELRGIQEQDKAKVLFEGMFKRSKTKVGAKGIQKGRYAQALAGAIQDAKVTIVTPKYIQDALDFVCKA